MQYLTLDDVLGINEFVMAQQRQQSLLRDVNGLESAMMRPQMAANYENADLARQTALIVSGIALAHPFVDGNKRTAIMAGEMFLDLNGYVLDSKPLEFANAILALVNRVDSLEAATYRLTTWIQARMRPQAPEHG